MSVFTKATTKVAVWRLKKMKTVWKFLDGWKTWIWAVLVAGAQLFPSLPIWTWLNSLATMLGWDKVIPAVDPTELVKWVWFAVAVFHKIKKALEQWKAGTPVADLKP